MRQIYGYKVTIFGSSEEHISKKSVVDNDKAICRVFCSVQWFEVTKGEIIGQS